MERHTGAAENMKSGGPDESSVERRNAPFRQLQETGHNLNHGFKVPAAKISLDLKDNASYMHPHDNGNGQIKPAIPPKAWGKANSIRSMSEQGAGKTGAPKLS